MNINTMGMEPLIRLHNLSAPSLLNMELFSVICHNQGSLRRPTGPIFSVEIYATKNFNFMFLIQRCLVFSLSQARTHIS